MYAIRSYYVSVFAAFNTLFLIILSLLYYSYQKNVRAFKSRFSHPEDFMIRMEEPDKTET